MPRPAPNKMTKRRIAEAQLYRAVKLLQDEGDAVSALTLAGAAEEILGKMVQARGRDSAFEETAFADRKLWDTLLLPHAVAKGVQITPPDDKEIRRRNNRLRNEFKHNDRGKNSSVVADFRYWAEEMILRALRNYELLYDKLPPQKAVQDWWEFISL